MLMSHPVSENDKCQRCISREGDVVEKHLAAAEFTDFESIMGSVNKDGRPEFGLCSDEFAPLATNPGQFEGGIARP